MVSFVSSSWLEFLNSTLPLVMSYSLVGVWPLVRHGGKSLLLSQGQSFSYLKTIIVSPESSFCLKEPFTITHDFLSHHYLASVLLDNFHICTGNAELLLEKGLDNNSRNAARLGSVPTCNGKLGSGKWGNTDENSKWLSSWCDPAWNLALSF